MPTYVYRCDACEETFEVFQSFSERALTTHDECGGEVRKVFQPSGVVFKGSGFYKTDSRSSNGSGPTTTSDAPASSPSSSD